MSWQSVSRRGFLRGAAGAAALGSAAWRSSAWPAEPREKLPEFNYSAVRLTGGPLKSQFARIHASYLTLDDDRVLKVYRQRAGLPAPGEFTLSIRVPGWLEAEPKFTLNGKAHSLPARRGTFASIRRRWKKNDTLHLRFPLSFRTEPIDDQHSDTAAVMRGPLMYVALDPPQDLATTRLALPQQLTCAPHGSQFEYALADRRLQFKPFYAVQDETYNTYFLLGTRRNE
jgi:hypothetical protein